MIELYNGGCLEIMDELIAKGVVVDAIITDPPYGTTACRWDSVIPFDAMWERLHKLIKPNGAIVLFGSEPFSSQLRVSNIKHFKYDWIWNKEQAANFQIAKFQPMKIHEIISVFCLTTAIYKPQGIKKVSKTFHNKKRVLEGQLNHISSKFGQEYVRSVENYPQSILQFKRDRSVLLHPTQKAVKLMEYLIKTYTNEGEIVLDFTMGSGTTGVGCVKLGRSFIGIEIEKKCFDIADKRMNTGNFESAPRGFFG